MGLWAPWAGGRGPCSRQGGWNWMVFKIPFNPNHSMILRFCFIARMVTRGDLLPGIWIRQGIHRGVCPSTALRCAPHRRVAPRLPLKCRPASVTEGLGKICLVCLTHARQGASPCLALGAVPRARDFEVSPQAGSKGWAGTLGGLWVQGAAKLLGTNVQGAPLSSSQQVKKASAHWLLQGQQCWRLSSLLEADSCPGSRLTSLPKTRSEKRAPGNRPLFLTQTNELD